MVTPQLTRFDPEGDGELIQGIDFDKMKFDEGIDSVVLLVCLSNIHVHFVRLGKHFMKHFLLDVAKLPNNNSFCR